MKQCLFTTGMITQCWKELSVNEIDEDILDRLAREANRRYRRSARMFDKFERNKAKKYISMLVVCEYISEQRILKKQEK